MSLGKEFNVLIKGFQENDPELFFGPIEETDSFIILDERSRWPEVMVACGIFKSKGDARRNGWNKDIPLGFTEIPKIGKLRHKIFILKVEV